MLHLFGLSAHWNTMHGTYEILDILNKYVRLNSDMSSYLLRKESTKNCFRINCNNKLYTVAYLRVVGFSICHRNAIDIRTNLKLSFVAHLLFLVHLTTFYLIRLSHAALITNHVKSVCETSGTGLCNIP